MESEDQYIYNIDSTLVSLKNKLRKINHINPYTNKRMTRMTKNNKEQLEKIKNIAESNANTQTNEEKVAEYYRILRQIAEMDKPSVDIDEQLCDLRQSKESKGIMAFEWNIDCQDTYINAFTLIIAPSKSGKSFLINQLIYELPQSFDKIVFFMNPDSWRNKCPQTLKYIADKVGIKTQWINTEQDTQPPFNDDPRMCYEDLNEDGSSRFIDNNTTYGTIYIFDDLYTKPQTHWIVNFMDQFACMGRHRKTSSFIAFQGFSRLSNKIVDNSTRIFLYNDILKREDLFRKLKRPPPDNLDIVLNDIRNGLGTRWYYLDDNELVEYVPYEIVSKQQALSKMRSKLPKSITDEAKKKEMEEKTKLARQLEQELGIKNPYEQESKDKSAGIDIKLKHIKDAKKITDKEYAEEFNTNEHKFIKQSKRNLRSKYGL